MMVAGAAAGAVAGAVAGAEVPVGALVDTSVVPGAVGTGAPYAFVPVVGVPGVTDVDGAEVVVPVGADAAGLFCVLGVPCVPGVPLDGAVLLLLLLVVFVGERRSKR
jgi:hypothetical protein